MTRLGISLLICTMLLGCGDDDGSSELSGSVSRIYSLAYDTTRALMTVDELAIQYIDNGAVILQVVIVREQAGEIMSGTYDLASVGTVVGDRPEGPLPDFVSGSVTLGTFSAEDGAPISGSFAATVETTNSEYAVVGQFSTQLTLVP